MNDVCTYIRGLGIPDFDSQAGQVNPGDIDMIAVTPLSKFNTNITGIDFLNQGFVADDSFL